MNYKRVFIQNRFVHLILTAYKRKPIFIDNIELLRKSFFNAKNFFKFDIVALCVLPNHIHMILNPENISEYPEIITAIKYYFSKNIVIDETARAYRYANKGEKGIFQLRYFEHTIVSEKDLENQINYIHYNPVKHGIAEAVNGWKFSSFHKYMGNGVYSQDWGSHSDIKDIVNLDIE